MLTNRRSKLYSQFLRNCRCSAGAPNFGRLIVRQRVLARWQAKPDLSVKPRVRARVSSPSAEGAAQTMSNSIARRTSMISSRRTAAMQPLNQDVDRRHIATFNAALSVTLGVAASW